MQLQIIKHIRTPLVWIKVRVDCYWIHAECYWTDQSSN